MSGGDLGLAALQVRWADQWPRALALWSRYARLSAPRWCLDPGDAQREGLSGSFAMIRLPDHAVVVDLRQVQARRLGDFALPVLAHEIGHHIYAPANLEDGGRALARVRRALPGVEHQAGMIANIYEDALINDRLHRTCSLDMAAIYLALEGGRSTPRLVPGNSTRTGGEVPPAAPSPSRLWTLYMRMYEILWSLRRGTLARGEIEPVLDGDAHLGARVLRSYANEWVRGAGRFAALCFPYLLEDQAGALQEIIRPLLDAVDAGRGGPAPDGLAACDADEENECLHPARDGTLEDFDSPDASEPGETAPSPALGQYREPFEYGQLLRALGLQLTDHEAAVRYYRERARPHLVPFLTRERPETQEPLPEGLEPWDVGSPLENVDWLESVMVSPRIVPGVSTRQRTWGTVDGALPRREPLDLDLYIDSSGSMPNPQHAVSYLALAGAIVALSALRAGARVQATVWSGAGQFESTPGFVRDETAVMRIVTGFICGGTAFPIHVLRETYSARRTDSPPAHILCISDEGVDTMFARDEQGSAGRDVARTALARARGGGTMVLNLWQEPEQIPALVQAARDGWKIFRVTAWEELEAFARAFSRSRYGAGAASGGRMSPQVGESP